MISLSRRRFLGAAGASCLAGVDLGLPPAVYGPTPSPSQLAWHRMETCAFLHLSMNTFTDREWGYGDEDPQLFNPAEFDADAIVHDLKAGGLKGVILTAKHHDGFCLWPTRTTAHSIRSSRWRDGRGDVVGEISAAARRAGLSFGVYVSPWDRSSAKYGTPEYPPLYREQVRELLTGYGPIFEVWFDGANGGDGFYGGARERRRIPAGYYEWEKTLAMVHELQPQAVIFGAAGDIRWVGNEQGIAGDPCWATMDPALTGLQDDFGGNEELARSTLQHGVRNGTLWKPAECDVSIRPGWFWHEVENGRVKSPQTLVDLYLRSVGRGAGLLLNVPPSRRGLIEPGDADSLRAFRRTLDGIFSDNLAARARLTPSNVRGGSRAFGAGNLVDGNEATYWATDDGVTTPELVADLGSTRQIGVIRLREAIQLGQRIGSFAVDAWQDGGWRQIWLDSCVGACRIIRLPQAAATSRLRLRITDSSAAVALADLGVFAPPS